LLIEAHARDAALVDEVDDRFTRAGIWKYAISGGYPRRRAS
jgi:hypothetical protein